MYSNESGYNTNTMKDVKITLIKILIFHKVKKIMTKTILI